MSRRPYENRATGQDCALRILHAPDDRSGGLRVGRCGEEQQQHERGDGNGMLRHHRSSVGSSFTFWRNRVDESVRRSEFAQRSGDTGQCRFEGGVLQIVRVASSEIAVYRSDINYFSQSDLKTNKRASGRNKDLADLDNLP